MSKFTRTLEVFADTVKAGDTIMVWGRYPNGRQFRVTATGTTDYGDTWLWLEGRDAPEVCPPDVTVAILSA